MGRKEYSVRLGGLHDIEYRDKQRTVVLEADLRDHAVHLGRERVTAGPPMTEAQRQTVIERVYDHVNNVRGMRIDFLRPDGSHWGERQGWEAPAYTEADRQKYIVRPRQRAQGNWSQRLRARLGID